MGDFLENIVNAHLYDSLAADMPKDVSISGILAEGVDEESAERVKNKIHALHQELGIPRSYIKKISFIAFADRIKGPDPELGNFND